MNIIVLDNSGKLSRVIRITRDTPRAVLVVVLCRATACRAVVTAALQQRHLLAARDRHTSRRHAAFPAAAVHRGRSLGRGIRTAVRLLCCAVGGASTLINCLLEFASLHEVHSAHRCVVDVRTGRRWVRTNSSHSPTARSYPNTGPFRAWSKQR